MSKLVVLSGVPGSGKSYISTLVKARMRQGHVYVISSDRLRTQICGSQKCFDYDSLMWKMFYELAKVYSLDKEGIVILDSTSSKREYRINNVKPVKGYFDQTILVVFNLDKVTVMRQNLEREYPIPSDALEYLYDTFEKVNEEDKAFFDDILFVDHHDLEPIIDAIIY